MFSSLFNDSFYRSCFAFTMVLFPLTNNFISRGDPMHSINFKTKISVPRLLRVLLLLFPADYFEYKVPVFALLSQIFFWLVLAAAIVLEIFGICLPLRVQLIVPIALLVINVIMILLSIWDGHNYYKEQK